MEGGSENSHGRQGILRIQGLKDTLTSTVIDVTIGFDCQRVVVTDELSDTVNYVPILELLVAGLRHSVPLPALETLVKCADSRIYSLSIRNQAVHRAVDSLDPNLLVSLGSLPLTVNAIFGCCPIERTRPQPMNLHISVDADLKQNADLRKTLLSDIFEIATTAETLTIERMAALMACALTKKVSRCTVIVEKPEIGQLCGHDMQNVSFELSLRAGETLNRSEIAGVPLFPSIKATASMAERADQFKSLRSMSTEYDFIADYLRDKALISLERVSSLSILDVGAGFGFLPSLSFLRGRGVRSYIAFEPNPYMLKELSQAVLDVLRPTTHNIVNELFTFATAQQALLHEKVNLAVLCHSMYGCGKSATRELLTEVAARLDPQNGICFVVHRASNIFANLTDIVSMFHVVHAQVVNSEILTLPDQQEMEAAVKCLNCYFGVNATSPEEKDELLGYFKATGGKLDTRMLMMVLKPRQQDPSQPNSGGQNLSPISSELTELSYHVRSVFQPTSAEFQDFMRAVKNRDARATCPSAIVIPESILEVQAVARWASRFGVQLSVLGGGHSDHCCSAESVVISLRKFQSVTVDREKKTVCIGGGATIKHITDACEPHNLFVPLGSRPSVGVGVVLHGGVGHFTFSHGLSSDSILTATVVLPNGDIAIADSSSGGSDLLFAIRGCGSIVGIVVNIEMKCYTYEPLYTCHINPCKELQSADDRLTCITNYFSQQQEALQPSTSRRQVQDAYFDCRGNAWFQTFSFDVVPNATKLEKYSDVFDAELHCLFPKAPCDFKRTVMVGSVTQLPKVIASIIESAPTNVSYLHALECGLSEQALAAVDHSLHSCFNRRRWNWLIVVTGRWMQDHDAGSVRRWVFKSVEKIIAASDGAAFVYPADLGSFQEEDTHLAMTSAYDAESFQPLTALKSRVDPLMRMPHGFPLVRSQKAAQRMLFSRRERECRLKAVIAICGKRFVGKDFIAAKMVNHLQVVQPTLTVANAGISEVFKRRYAAATGCDLHRLLHDRPFKEHHREGMTRYYESTKSTASDEDTLHALINAYIDSADVLIVTGMREANVVEQMRALSIPVMSIFVTAPAAVREGRGWQMNSLDLEKNERLQDFSRNWDCIFVNESETASDACPSRGPPKLFAFLRDEIEPFIRGAVVPCALSPGAPAYQVLCGIQQIPRPGMIMKDFYSLTSQPQLLRFITEWMCDAIRDRSRSTPVKIVTVETGGILFAKPVADALSVPLIVIRKGEGEKEPTPNRKVTYRGSNVTNRTTTLQLRVAEISKLSGCFLVFIDDTLSSGRTLDAVAEVLGPRSKVSLALFLMEFPLCTEGGNGARPTTQAMIQFPGK